MAPDARASGKQGGLSRALFTSLRGDWQTPPDLLAELDSEFGFTLDPCPPVADEFEFREDGLTMAWAPERVFCNPPYGREIGKWVKKAWDESRKGALVVLLVPARTDTAWWHDYCAKGEVRFIRGRLRFWKDGKQGDPAPFPSAIVVFRPPRAYDLAFQMNQRNEMVDMGEQASCVMPPNQIETNLLQGSSVRRLTPTECERLQGFPDGWTEYANLSDPTVILGAWRDVGAWWIDAMNPSLIEQMESASSITSVCDDTEVSTYRPGATRASSPAGSATGWLEFMGHEDCVRATTSHGSDTAILCEPNGTLRTVPATPSVVRGITAKWHRLNLVGPSDPERLSTISTWISATTRQRISMSAATTPSICGFIVRWNAPPAPFLPEESFASSVVGIERISDSARYRMLGNAVCVNVAEWIGRRL